MKRREKNRRAGGVGWGTALAFENRLLCCPVMKEVCGHSQFHTGPNLILWENTHTHNKKTRHDKKPRARCRLFSLGTPVLRLRRRLLLYLSDESAHTGLSLTARAPFSPQDRRNAEHRKDPAEETEGDAALVNNLI